MLLKFDGSKRGIRYAALLLALLMHGLAVHVLTGSTAAHVEQASKIVDGRPLVASLLNGDRTSATETAGSPVVQLSVERYADITSTAEKAGKESQGVVITQPIGPHYFRLSELTERPMLRHDAVADLVLHIPGLPPQPVILRLLISEEGGIDRVIVEDSYLVSDIEQAVTDAFSRVRFEPGKIGSIAVRSQMRVEVRVESMERLHSGGGDSG